MSQVELHRFDADKQLGCHLPVRPAGGHQASHGHLRCRQVPPGWPPLGPYLGPVGLKLTLAGRDMRLGAQGREAVACLPEAGGGALAGEPRIGIAREPTRTYCQYAGPVSAPR